MRSRERRSVPGPGKIVNKNTSKPRKPQPGSLGDGANKQLCSRVLTSTLMLDTSFREYGTKKKKGKSNKHTSPPLFPGFKEKKSCDSHKLKARRD